MALRNPKTLIWRPAGCTDALDGPESFDGAMQALTNVVPSPRTAHQWVARPAATSVTTISANNMIANSLVIGDVAYGMIANGGGQDIPFAFNLSTLSTYTVSNVVTSTNCPTTQTTSGDWTPPILAQVGSRVVVTHPGFSNSAITSATAFSWLAAPTSGQTTFEGAPTLAVAGDTIAGTNIPGATTIVAVFNSQPAGYSIDCAGTIGMSTVTIDTNVAQLTGALPNAGMILYSQQPNLGVFGTIVNVSTTLNLGISTLTYSGFNTNTFQTGQLYWDGAEIIMSRAATGGAGPLGAGSIVYSVHPTVLSATQKFGWFDVSAASISYTANLVSGSPVFSLTTAFGVQPGMAISASALSTGTILNYIQSPSLQFQGNPPNFGDQALIVFSASPTSLPLPGMSIQGAGLQVGTTVAAPSSVLGFNTLAGPGPMAQHAINVPITPPAAGAVGLPQQPYVFSGLVVGTMNQTALATTQIPLLFTGGSTTTPLWHAGDTSYNNLPSQPVSVATLAGRAYFACGVNGFPYSDSAFSCQRTNASQAVVASDGLAITALGALPLLSPITGGIIQAIIGFAGVARMYQITGDQATNNLALNTMNVATGTLAPLSIFPTNFGLAFVSPEGVRVISFEGTISDPIGDPGSTKQIAYPFVNAQHPSRICGAATADTIRWTVLNGGTNQDWCYDISRKQFHGPHSLVYSVIQPWRSTFIVQPIGFGVGSLYNANIVPTGSPTYVENAVTISYAATTVLLPQNDEQAALGLVETSLFMGSLSSNTMTVVGYNETTQSIFTYSLTPTNTTARQRMIQFDKAQVDVFTQLTLGFTGTCDSQLVIGRMMLKYQDLGYQRYDTSISGP